MKCRHCLENEADQYYYAVGYLCLSCARRAIIDALSDMDVEETARLRRRAEDCIRKNPAMLRETIITLVLRGALDLHRD